MQIQTVPFEFDGAQFRVVIRDQTGMPWFVMLEVCRILRLTNVTMAARRLDESDRDTLTINDAVGRRRPMMVINEAGLFTLILRSSMPEAKRFQRWVTKDVLPTIRRTGSYSPKSVSEVEHLVEVIADRLLDRMAQSDGVIGKLVEKLNELMRIGDPRIAAVEYKPMLDVLVDMKVKNTEKRRTLSQRCSVHMKSWCNRTQRTMRVCPTSNRTLFNVDDLKLWMRLEGRALIKSHLAKVANETLPQGVLAFPFPKIKTASSL